MPLLPSPSPTGGGANCDSGARARAQHHHEAAARNQQRHRLRVRMHPVRMGGPLALRPGQRHKRRRSALPCRERGRRASPLRRTRRTSLRDPQYWRTRRIERSLLRLLSADLSPPLHQRQNEPGRACAPRAGDTTASATLDPSLLSLHVSALRIECGLVSSDWAGTLPTRLSATVPVVPSLNAAGSCRHDAHRQEEPQ